MDSCIGTFAANDVAMNHPSSSNNPSQEPVPPLSDQAAGVERESAAEAACDASACCESMIRFVKEHPCLSVGLALAIGLIAGRCVAIDN
ncbi:hypothetical protein [Luteolibacter soli]|uniref:Uncharacterized protein n=1 Tax=Luteolibacter soli TaxID=3135280 RepID=A0ABU9ANU3_9BACT